jgi:tRNA threonylcarbamoyladenosine modification (KEOPS) complex  Pcc1 subunit
MRSKVRYASLEIEFTADPRILLSIASSLAPENIEGKRLTVRTRTKKKGNVLQLSFQAADMVSLRAGMNTTLRLMLSALKILEATGLKESSRSILGKD